MPQFVKEQSSCVLMHLRNQKSFMKPNGNNVNKNVHVGGEKLAWRFIAKYIVHSATQSVDHCWIHVQNTTKLSLRHVDRIKRQYTTLQTTLLGRNGPSVLPKSISGMDLVTDFHKYFTDKISEYQAKSRSLGVTEQEIDSSCYNVHVSLSVFPPATAKEIKKIAKLVL